MQDHLSVAMYGDSSIQEKLLKEAADKHQEYCNMVYAALCSEHGTQLINSFEEYLKKPLYVAGQPDNIMYYKEGARQFILDLIAAYEQGKNPKK